MNYNIKNLIDLKSHLRSDAVITKDLIYRYTDVDTLSSSLAESIAGKIKNKEYVGICSDNSIEFVISVVAIWKIGAIPVPLNLLATEAELLKLVSLAGIKNIILKKSDNKIIQSLKTVNCFDASQIIHNTRASDKQDKYTHKVTKRVYKPLQKFNGKNEAVVIFTSGATGEPKGVIHTFNSLLSSVVKGNEIFNHQDNDRWLASLPFYHIGGFQIICRAFYYGACIIITESLQSHHLKEAINRFKPTHASFVSVQIKRLLDYDAVQNDELRCSLIGGGFINQELLLKAKKAGWHPIKVYGSSETASFICALNENDIEKNGGSTGKPVGNNQVKIVDENGADCAHQVEGEILIKSDSLFKLYLNNEPAKEEKLKEDYFLTGDIGYTDSNGLVYVTGRKNEMIVTGGKNVNPIEVETAILKYPGVIEAAVFPVNDIEWGEIVCAAIVSSKKIDIDNLKSFLKGELSSFKIPKRIAIENSLPKTSLGKIERNKLKKKYSG